ncbi:hypothetical protein [Yinghuangia sp. YIM S09857]|uniref:hypothetical protein n=1 Tax=Yinghuangia sp. YIM S09857 TaxID=3436929 RepID=UPI003F530718
MSYAVPVMDRTEARPAVLADSPLGRALRQAGAGVAGSGFNSYVGGFNSHVSGGFNSFVSGGFNSYVAGGFNSYVGKS